MRLAAVGLVLAAALAIAAAAAAADRPSPADLEAELVCPTCKTTLDQSDAPVARRMKAYIRERIAAGASADEIKADLVAQFGRGVLAEPPKEGFDLLAWVLPLAGVVLGAVLVGALAWSWSRGREPPAGPVEAPLDAELERRVDEELARYDG
ncbi:MAG TPA: cytochrome c-type biogenesis protein [Gaiellaceae bacterium]